MLAKGTLVRASVKVGHTELTRRKLEQSGELWVVMKAVKPQYDDTRECLWYWCKALSDGNIHDFHVSELTPANEANEGGQADGE